MIGLVSTANNNYANSQRGVRKNDCPETREERMVCMRIWRAVKTERFIGFWNAADHKTQLELERAVREKNYQKLIEIVQLKRIAVEDTHKQFGIVVNPHLEKERTYRVARIARENLRVEKPLVQPFQLPERARIADGEDFDAFTEN